MNTESLILELAGAGDSVRPNFSPRVRTALWLAVSVFWVAAVSALIGPRPDLANAIRGDFCVSGQALLLLAATGLSALAAFRAGVPGEKFSRWMLPTAIPFFVWAGWVCYEAARFPSEPGIGFHCLRNLALLGSVPGVLFFFLLKRALPLRTGWAGGLAALGAFTLANAGTCFICQHDSPGHIFVWHFLPVLSCGLVGLRLGPAFFSAKPEPQKIPE